MSPISRKPLPEQSKGLINFLKQELKRRGISMRSAAIGIGISDTHLSHIMTGKKTPDAGVCNAIAIYFERPKLEIYRLAGWLDVQDDTNDLETLRQIAENDNQFSEWKKVYESIGEAEERKMFVKILSTLKQHKSG